MWRRTFLKAGGACVAGLFLPAMPVHAGATVEVRLISEDQGARVRFDPVGLFVEPGTRVVWINDAGVHTVTAYHPANESHALRIPHDAEPWDSGYLVEPGQRFERVLSVPGVYDYYCKPHEAAGMVGRLVVGMPVGPGAEPFNYFHGRHAWRAVPEAGRRRLPPAAAIVRRRVIRRCCA